MSSEHLTLRSEIDEIEKILARLSPANVIKRKAFESRLKSAKKALESVKLRLPRKRNLRFVGSRLSVPTALLWNLAVRQP
jgi:hypothetical protein